MWVPARPAIGTAGEASQKARGQTEQTEHCQASDRHVVPDHTLPKIGQCAPASTSDLGEVAASFRAAGWSGVQPRVSGVDRSGCSLMSQWYQFRAQAKGAAEIVIYDEIGFNAESAQRPARSPVTALRRRLLRGQLRGGSFHRKS